LRVHAVAVVAFRARVLVVAPSLRQDGEDAIAGGRVAAVARAAQVVVTHRAGAVLALPEAACRAAGAGVAVVAGGSVQRGGLVTDAVGTGVDGAGVVV